MRGDTGVQGAPGQTGPVGYTGLRGETGVQGSTGLAGNTGPQGRTGIRGDTGVQGAPGQTGPQGYTGPRGETGVMGATGPVGDTGLQGKTGPVGYTGPRGETGVRGETGAEGVRGNTGPVGYTGPRGDTGVQGSTGIVGDTGVQGRTGVRGETGVVGAPGATGPVGYTGPRGDTGVRGQTGETGQQGRTGVDGPRGNTGAKGADGLVGFGAAVVGDAALYWPFRTGSGSTVEDMSASGSRPGGLSASGVTWVDNGYLGKTLSFDGTGYVESAEDAAFFDTDLAFEAFIICDNYSAQARNVIFSMNIYPSFLRVTSAGYLIVEVPLDGGSGAATLTGATVLQTGRLYHVAVSVNATEQTVRLYLDGVQDAVLTSTVMLSLQDRTVYVGRDFNVADSNFRGIIDEVRFYDRPLTVAEVVAHSRQVYLTGEKGVVGATGAAGRTGSRGETGAVGAPGATGLAGHTGPRGDTGAQGAAGQVGFGAAVLGSNIYLYWPFRAGTGMTVEDMTTVGSRPGTLSAASVAWVENGTLGNTLSFGGTGSVRTDYQYEIQSGTLSFEAFIIGDNFAAQAYNFVVGFGYEAFHLTVTSAGYLRYYFTDETDYQEVIGQTVLETGRLYHVAVTHDATSGITRLYVDGVEDGVLTGHAAISVEDFRVIVGRTSDNTYGFRGIIDEVRYYLRALTAAEVLAHSRQVYLTGEKGVVGVTGAAGRTGSRGETGVVGAPGATGPVGYTGPRGETGVRGATGPVGDTGPQGKTGPIGDTGPRGNTGVQGSTGIIGDTGPQGKTGVRGETGVVGAPGATGSVGYTGPRGETGVRGATGLVGETGLQGRTGQRGETGEKGAQGSPGDTGVQGLTGLIGDTLAHHIQLSTGGWVRAGGSTAGVLFGETGGAFGLWGRGDNATQFEVSALDGRAYFGERAVTMDRDGLVLIADTGYADKRSIRWVSGSSTMGYVRAKAPVGGSYLTLESQGITGSAAYCEVIANGFTGQPCAAVLKAAWSGGGSSPAEIVTYVDGYGATRMDLRSSTVAVVGGLACTPYDDEVGLGDGIIWGREGIAAGESQKVWKLGGYTGSAALATGYTWIEINGTLYKILDRDSADARYAAFPAGVLTAFGGASPPSGWLLCDGAAVSRSTYAALFAAIGTTYGVGDGSTTFNLPELRQKFLRGKGASDTLGAAGGAATHTHAAHGALSHSGAAVADHAALGHTGAAVTAHSTASSKFGTAAGTVVTTATHTVTQPAQHAAQSSHGDAAERSCGAGA